MKTSQDNIHQGNAPYQDSLAAETTYVEPAWDNVSSVSDGWELSGLINPDYIPLSAPAIHSADTAEELFGNRSRLETFQSVSEPEPLPVHQKQNKLILDGLIVLLFFYYCVHLFRHWGAINLLLRSFVMPGHFYALIEEQSVAFRTYTRSSCVMGFFALLAITLKWGLIWDESDAAVMYPDELTPYWLPVLIIVFVSIFLYKRVILGIIAILNGRNSPVTTIRTFNRLFFTMASLFLVPVGLLCGLADPTTHRWLFVFEVIILTAITLGYILKSFSFFASRKIPFLQWILYLCAVEIWPISFYILFAVRGFEW